MEQNKNLSFWRTVCQIGACVDLATQILGIIGMCVVFVLFLPFFTNPEIEWMWKALFAVIILLLIMLQLLLFAYALMMIKAASGGRDAKHMLKIATRWKAGQWALLSLGLMGLPKGHWEAVLIAFCIRVPMLLIATKFINELKKEAENEGENTEPKQRTRRNSDDVEEWDA